MNHINTKNFKTAKHLAITHMSADRIRTDHITDNHISVALTGKRLQELNIEAGIRSIAYIGNTNGSKKQY